MTTVAQDIAARTAEAYSRPAYSSDEWGAIIVALLERGYSEAETEWVMNSKFTRWAADASGRPRGWTTAGDFLNWLEDPKNRASVADVRRFMADEA